MRAQAEHISGGETTVTFSGVTFKTHLAFAAQQTGANPASGHLVAWEMTSDTTSAQKFYVAGPVTCLNVVGSNATIEFQVEKTNNPFLTLGEFGAFDVSDNDLAQAPDTQEFLGYSPTPVPCPPPFEGSTPLTSGSFEVNQGDPTLLTPCPATSTTYYAVDSNCNVLYLTDSGWQTAP